MSYFRKKRRHRSLIKLILWVLFIGGGFFATQYYYANTMMRAVDAENVSKVAFEIESGQSLKTISENLKERDLIRSAAVFRSYLKGEKLDQDVKAGNFILNRSMTSQQIADLITSNEVTEEAVTIQEGLTVTQIDKKLYSAGLITEGELINFSINNLSEDELAQIPSEFLEILRSNNSNLEGLLFPDTYFINRTTFSLNAFVIRLIRTMDSNITAEMRKTYEVSGRNLYEVLNMASIVEREVRTDEDIATVAGILWKRYDSNWHIGADATLLYVTKKNTISVEDLEIDSAFNTRKFLGLPPTAISNPGLQSIKGTVYPKHSDFWYYLTTLDTGEVIYAKTNDEHNMNKAKYLK